MVESPFPFYSQPPLHLAKLRFWKLSRCSAGEDLKVVVLMVADFVSLHFLRRLLSSLLQGLLRSSWPDFDAILDHPYYVQEQMVVVTC